METIYMNRVKKYCLLSFLFCLSTINKETFTMINNLNESEFELTQPTHLRRDNCKAISKNGIYFATGDIFGKVAIFERETNKRVFEYSHKDSSIVSIIFSQNENLAVSVSSCLAIDKGQVKIFDIKNKREIFCTKDFPDITSIALSSDNRLIALGSAAGCILIYDIKTRKLLYQYKHKHFHYEYYEEDYEYVKIPNATIECIAFSNDNKHIVCGTESGMLIVCNIEKNKAIEYSLEKNIKITSITYTNDNQIIYGTENGRIASFDPEKKIRKRLSKHTNKNQDIQSLIISDNGRFLASGSGYGLCQNGELQIFDLEKNRATCLWHLDSCVKNICFIKDEIISLDDKGNIYTHHVLFYTLQERILKVDQEIQEKKGELNNLHQTILKKVELYKQKLSNQKELEKSYFYLGLWLNDEKINKSKKQSSKIKEKIDLLYNEKIEIEKVKEIAIFEKEIWENERKVLKENMPIIVRGTIISQNGPEQFLVTPIDAWHKKTPILCFAPRQFASRTTSKNVFIDRKKKEIIAFEE